MSDIKKFLDYEGVQHLWSKINMNDYPNNETLINVINAIDETKADRSELVQSDWNENDETAINYIKSRTHYENIVEVPIVLIDEDADLIMFPDVMPEYYWSEPIALENGKTYTVTVNDVQQELVCENDALIFVDTQQTGDTLTIKSEVIFGNIQYTYHIKIETTEVSTTVKQLDEKYIPDTIARTSDLLNSGVATLPVHTYQRMNDRISLYKVNLADLKQGILYSARGLLESSDTDTNAISLVVVCEDGTEKNIAADDGDDLWSIFKSTKHWTLYCKTGNNYYGIDVADLSTAANVTYTWHHNYNYLDVHNEYEYTPTNDYHPATKKYVDDTATTAANAIKNDLLNGAGEAYDTLKELGNLIDDNVDAIEALEIIATGKANISDIPTKVSELTNDSGFITEVPQADWTQTDEAATNYIKNKPILATSEEIKALFN